MERGGGPGPPGLGAGSDKSTRSRSRDRAPREVVGPGKEGDEEGYGERQAVLGKRAAEDPGSTGPREGEEAGGGAWPGSPGPSVASHHMTTPPPRLGSQGALLATPSVLSGGHGDGRGRGRSWSGGGGGGGLSAVESKVSRPASTAAAAERHPEHTHPLPRPSESVGDVLTSLAATPPCAPSWGRPAGLVGGAGRASLREAPAPSTLDALAAEHGFDPAGGVGSGEERGGRAPAVIKPGGLLRDRLLASGILRDPAEAMSGPSGHRPPRRGWAPSGGVAGTRPAGGAPGGSRAPHPSVLDALLGEIAGDVDERGRVTGRSGEGEVLHVPGDSEAGAGADPSSLAAGLSPRRDPAKSRSACKSEPAAAAAARPRPPSGGQLGGLLDRPSEKRGTLGAESEPEPERPVPSGATPEGLAPSSEAAARPTARQLRF